MSIFRTKENPHSVKKNRRISNIPKAKNSPAQNTNAKKTKRKKKKPAGENLKNRRKSSLTLHDDHEGASKEIDDISTDNNENRTDRTSTDNVDKVSKTSFASGGATGLRSVFKFILFLFIVALIFKAGQMVYHFGTTSSNFSVKYIDITGNDHLTNAEVIKASGFKTDDNIFSLDLLNIQKKIETNPWVLSAKVSQKLPSTIVIDIIEHEVEMLIIFDVPYIIDNRGEIFKRWQSGDPLAGVVLTGVPKKDLREDSQYVEQIILDAIALKNLYVKMGSERRAPLYEIHREPDGAFSLTAGIKPFYIRLGHPPYRKKLTRLTKLLKKISKAGKQPAIIYFDNKKRPDRVTVKFKK